MAFVLASIKTYSVFCNADQAEHNVEDERYEAVTWNVIVGVYGVFMAYFGFIVPNRSRKCLAEYY